MASTKKILTSLHGKKVGLNSNGDLVVAGRTALTANDGGAVFGVQGTPGTLDTTGTLTGALIAGGIVTSAAAAVTATLDTGTAMAAAFGDELHIGDCVDWSVIKIGANTFTIAGDTGHTVVGALAVATATSASFRTLRTAASTFITYRLS